MDSDKILEIVRCILVDDSVSGRKEISEEDRELVSKCMWNAFRNNFSYIDLVEKAVLALVAKNEIENSDRFYKLQKELIKFYNVKSK